MTILERYIAKTILSGTGLVLVVLLGLYTFMDFVAELDDLGKGQYQVMEILLYLSLSMPKRIYELLPIAALLGSMIGLGNLATQSELVVMRAAGLSVEKISKAVLIVAGLLMVIALFVGEVIRPPAEQSAREIQSMAQTGTVGSRSEHGFWTRDGYHFNHIGQILPDGGFSDISIYEFDTSSRLRVLTKAAAAKFEDGEWILSDVVQSTVNPEGIKINAVSYARWTSKLNPGMVNVVVVPPEFLAIWGLLEYIDYLETNRQATSQYELAFWMKVIMPISSAVMVFLAVPFIFGPLRSAPIGGRIVTGTLIGIGFYLFNQSFQHIGLVFGMLPFLAAAFPTIVFAGIGYYLMKRVY
jgi:lipopolysaccharide export system permease protein